VVAAQSVGRLCPRMAWVCRPPLFLTVAVDPSPGCSRVRLGFAAAASLSVPVVLDAALAIRVSGCHVSADPSVATGWSVSMQTCHATPLFALVHRRDPTSVFGGDLSASALPPILFPCPPGHRGRCG
jgi:hypothetical protein